jgi:hypothetical protein
MDTSGNEYDWEIIRLENLSAIQLWQAGQKVAASDKCQPFSSSYFLFFRISVFICAHLRSPFTPCKKSRHLMSSRYF